jgi:hypothetical protein
MLVALALVWSVQFPFRLPDAGRYSRIHHLGILVSSETTPRESSSTVHFEFPLAFSEHSMSSYNTCLTKNNNSAYIIPFSHVPLEIFLKSDHSADKPGDGDHTSNKSSLPRHPGILGTLRRGGSSSVCRLRPS